MPEPTLDIRRTVFWAMILTGLSLMIREVMNRRPLEVRTFVPVAAAYGALSTLEYLAPQVAGPLSMTIAGVAVGSLISEGTQRATGEGLR